MELQSVKTHRNKLISNSLNINKTEFLDTIQDESITAQNDTNYISDKAKQTLVLASKRYYNNEQSTLTQKNKRNIGMVLDESDEKSNKKLKTTAYNIPELSQALGTDIANNVITEFPGIRDLQFIRPYDSFHFKDLLTYKKKNECNEDEARLRTSLKLILRIKNGTSQNRKTAMKQIVETSSKLGINTVFDKIFSILLEQSLSEQERYILVKALDRLISKFQWQVRPYTHRIFIVLSPLLMDEDPVTNQLGADVVATTAKAVGHTCIITSIRQDIDNEDDQIRNLASKILAICSKALGPNLFFPFIHAMCHSKKKWEIRSTGAKTIQNLSLLLGLNILPYLGHALQSIDGLLEDEQVSVRIVTANAIAALSTSCSPNGVQLFEKYVVEQLGNGIKQHRGKLLVSFLRAISNIIPMMNSEYANFYGKYVLSVIKREMTSPDSEMVKIVLLSLQRCVETPGLMTIKQCKEEICPDFFKKFWTRRVALDLQLNKLVNFTTVVLAKKVGTPFVLNELVIHLKDSSEPSRLMTVYAINRIFTEAEDIAGISPVLENQLIDGLLVAFQDQRTDTPAFVNCFGTVANVLGERMSKYLPPIISTILNNLKNKNPEYRQLAADLCNKMIPECFRCGELEMLTKLNIIFYEALGEPYPEVLGSVLACIDSILKTCSDLSTVQPPISQLLPTLTPILRNSHPKVNENILKLIDQIAQRSGDLIPPKEWMRVSNELIEMLKSPRKTVRIQANETFGNIAKTIGPQEILVSLLNNLKVQERQLRLCSSIAIAIVAEKCGTYTVLPALMNEYKTPDIHVQNGILKAMAFLFEYIGHLGSDYIYMMAPVLQDSLIDRDLVHRQTAATILKNMALSCKGAGHEDFFVHLLNIIIPNVFETSPHAISRILSALDGVRVALGPGIFMGYIWAGLFHPSRRVRVAYWNVYNTSYIHEGDNLVPFYPDMPGKNVEELEYVI